jgi:hypothetical protein
MEVSGQLHARPLYPQGKSPLYALDRRLLIGGAITNSLTAVALLLLRVVNKASKSVVGRLVGRYVGR